MSGFRQRLRARLRQGLGWALCAGLLLGTAVPSAHAAADPAKVLRTVFSAAETGFDPAAIRDLYSGYVVEAVFDRLYTYDYLARPAKLVPLAAEAMPQISADGLTWTIRVRKGIFFADDPAFGGKPRELSAADFVYSFRRLLDPALNSPYAWLFEGKVRGLDDSVAQARRDGQVDYDKPVAGFELADRYTLRIHLTHPDYNLGYILAHMPTSAVAREVVERYRDRFGQVMDHPVGSGPYRLKQWTRGAKIVLEANPSFRHLVWNFTPGSDPEAREADAQIAARMRGKTLPRIGRIEISVLPEDQTRWLAFQRGEVDIFQLEGPLAPKALDGGKLRPELAQHGVRLSRDLQLELSYYYWNLRDPVFGGLSPAQIALRRAIAMAYDVDEEIRLIWNGEAQRLDFPIPPGAAGHDAAYRPLDRYDPAAANRLLDRYGFRRGADGWRTRPDGGALVLRYSARPSLTGQQQSELWKKSLAAIGVRMEEDRRPFQELIKAEKQCQLLSRTAAWFGDYPDGDNFMQLFYGGNIGQSNNGCASVPEYDRLYEQARVTPPGPARDAMFRRLARLLEVYAPIKVGYARYRNMLLQPRVIGFKKHPILHAEWLYLDIDTTP